VQYKYELGYFGLFYGQKNILYVQNDLAYLKLALPCANWVSAIVIFIVFAKLANTKKWHNYCLSKCNFFTELAKLSLNLSSLSFFHTFHLERISFFHEYFECDPSKSLVKQNAFDKLDIEKV
jgi:hypothetical protein